MPVTAALIGAGATMLTNRANTKRAREAMAFEADQSATAHQREVKDLRAAGLNPILSGTGGSGASTASGKAPVMENPTNSALSALRAKAELSNLISTGNNIDAQTDAIEGGTLAKTAGTDAYNKVRDTVNTVTNPKPSSAKQVNRKSNFDLKKYEQTTPEAEKRIQRLMRQNNKFIK